MKKENIITVPNILALIRLLLVPVVFVLIMKDEYILALVLFLIACLTDLADGYIARHYNLVTQLGTFLDPLADKCMAVMVIIGFTLKGVLPLWITIVIFVKELLMLIGGLLAAKHAKKVLPSNKFGKVAAFIFNASIATCFLHMYLNPFYKWFIAIALVGSVASLVQYALKNKDLLLNN